MTDSYKKINYSLRPAKSIERKMMVEAFRRLTEFGSVESYRYVGFGSTYFTDFSLVHRSLGITNMISIERATHDQTRFAFNRPFRCISIQFGESNNILPSLPWDVRTILWLDYDGKLDSSVLTDIDFFCANAHPGSVLVVSVNASAASVDDVAHPNRLLQLEHQVGREKVPNGVKEKELAKGTAGVYVRVITNEIDEQLTIRNGGRAKGTKIMYRQIFNFRYADEAPMLTIGGLVYDEGQSGLLEKCGFDRLPFVRSDVESFDIEIPKLTYREIRHLDAQLPAESVDLLTAQGIPPSDLAKYLKIYRYFPMFAETDV